MTELPGSRAGAGTSASSASGFEQWYDSTIRRRSAAETTTGAPSDGLEGVSQVRLHIPVVVEVETARGRLDDDEQLDRVVDATLRRLREAVEAQPPAVE